MIPPRSETVDRRTEEIDRRENILIGFICEPLASRVCVRTANSVPQRLKAGCAFCAAISSRLLFVLNELERLFLAECVAIFGGNWTAELRFVLRRGGKWMTG